MAFTILKKKERKQELLKFKAQRHWWGAAGRQKCSWGEDIRGLGPHPNAILV